MNEMLSLTLPPTPTQIPKHIEIQDRFDVQNDGVVFHRKGFYSFNTCKEKSVSCICTCETLYYKMYFFYDSM